MAEDTQSTITYGIFNETAEHESRVALTPDIVKRLKRSAVDCVIERNAGHAAGFSDEDYIKAGAKVVSKDEVIAQSQAFGFVERPDDDLVARLPKGSWVIGMLGSFTDQEYVDRLDKAGLVGVGIEKLPRQLSSAQSMDEMTSQNSVMGYKAVLKAADAYGSFFPMMTTAAGTIRPAKVLILGAGIAGLQAIGTARRLGAVVTAYDVRPAAKGEVESLGAKFLELGLDFSKGQGEGGYARQLTAEEQAAQQVAVDKKAAEFDIVITTAKVPGRKPPMLLTQAGVDGLHRGAVIVDCAASDLGGNVAGSKPNQTIVTDNGVQLIGAPDLASGVATTASNLLARNVADVLAHFVNDGKLAMDLTEELDNALIVAGRVETPATAIEEEEK
ncbi:NAD(P) transhydrogenase subunit alpha [Bifidobacterium sp. 82T24]|uniref:NAD(P) transhydrogenase subunit alpha n=1 Tax=Bifidobacterium pluvialisilvae TaxID=2834436 RepID=UPI001C56E04D|nr:NAD(P) transhydrogenase subunit alpha [Bifidobacterium pluvialisilvae]MBW3088104.1 NAD(P) transhydrogenase subunit alpha [Bifidobacterium pluvialisilvae]